MIFATKPLLNISRPCQKKKPLSTLVPVKGSYLFSWDLLKGVQEILSVEPSNKARLKALERFDHAKEKRGFVEPQVTSRIVILL